MTHPTDPVAAMREACKTIWQDLLERDDRTSPAEYPDMALITFDEFVDCLDAARVALPCLPIPAAQPDPRDEVLRLAREAVTEAAETLQLIGEARLGLGGFGDGKDHKADAEDTFGVYATLERLRAAIDALKE